jgi:hypothetical protein
MLRKLDFGGEGEIRTPEALASLPVFKTGAFNRSATSPLQCKQLVTSILSGDRRPTGDRQSAASFAALSR